MGLRALQRRRQEVSADAAHHHNPEKKRERECSQNTVLFIEKKIYLEYFAANMVAIPQLLY